MEYLTAASPYVNFDPISPPLMSHMYHKTCSIKKNLRGFIIQSQKILDFWILMIFLPFFIWQSIYYVYYAKRIDMSTK